MSTLPLSSSPPRPGLSSSPLPAVRSWAWLAWAWFALLPVVTGCSALKPACAVIDIAHNACEYVTVEYLDDNGDLQRERVSTQALRSAALDAKERKAEAAARARAESGPSEFP